ncbi:MAG TPA: basic amino acid ABC transporter substrate-binding protein [Dictyoglomaceae bacterium]|nr:basic amino acid ABC transporter substrate-binding protein [Dictyoglomaceae bacterium]HOL38767.1 basic amino acid ABC transporter substrate-binding protein [Dictyoglomaceae bacterium]HOP94529.1 basic amino acid ABC transporter substrate-binding protein [Dictyoglomaceae bacterium]HPP15484.1 basic amino acid ABC transporter substrate-binding protein [Dictyoglomaceae bacterium]HPU43107.1 basic amino acid ABC transporter substrate-binding protein [Dictyoglomaceae bacterium]
MRRLSCLFLFLALFSLPILGAGAVDRIKKAGVLKVGSDVAYAPFEYMEGDKAVGFDIDIAQEIANALGVKLQIINTSFDGIIAALKAKKFDIIISAMTITDERKKEIDFSIPYYDSGQIIVVRADNNTIKTEKDLKGKIVGVQLGTTGELTAKKLKDQVGIKEIRSYETIPEAFMDLELGRLDAIINDLPVSLYYAKTRPKLKCVGEVFTTEQYGIALRKEDKDLRDKINEILLNLKKTGKYNKIYKKWFGVEPK